MKPLSDKRAHRSSAMTDAAVEAAIAALDSETANTTEKIEMLLEMAKRLQYKPEDAYPLQQACQLYDRALAIAPPESLAYARAQAGKATVLRSLPEEGAALLLAARDLYETALPTLGQQGSPEERAEAQMNLGLVLQSLLPYRQARLADCIRLYQQALEVFTGKSSNRRSPFKPSIGRCSRSPRSTTPASTPCCKTTWAMRCNTYPAATPSRICSGLLLPTTKR